MTTATFDAPLGAGYPFRKMFLIRLCIALGLILFAADARAQTVAFVAPGGGTSAQLSRVVLQSFLAIEEQDDFDTLSSNEMRRALAGLPAPTVDDGADDPLADVRRLLRRAQGDRLRQSLSRLGDRVGVDLLITVRSVGDEAELRAYNVEREAFYRGTLMISASTAPNTDEILSFVSPRVSALDVGEAEGEEEEERPTRRRNRWWIWAIVGGAVAAAVLVGYLVQPDEVEDQGVNLRITAP